MSEDRGAGGEGETMCVFVCLGMKLWQMQNWGGGAYTKGGGGVLNEG